MRFPYPSREPTPSEYAVLVVFIAAAFIILGVIALVAPAEKHELASYGGIGIRSDQRRNKGSRHTTEKTFDLSVAGESARSPCRCVNGIKTLLGGDIFEGPTRPSWLKTLRSGLAPAVLVGDDEPKAFNCSSALLLFSNLRH